MDALEINREVRKQRRLERFGCNNPRCATCGESDDRTLELHHVAGRKHDSTTVVVCRNCHRKVSDDQKDYPTLTENADSALYAIGSFLLGLADMLRLAVEKLYEYGKELMTRASIVSASRGPLIS